MLEQLDDRIVGRARFGVAYEGPPGCVHGGYVAAARENSRAREEQRLREEADRLRAVADDERGQAVREKEEANRQRRSTYPRL